MYSAEERDQLLERLTVTARDTDGVRGLVLVGSGALGFRDNCSDLDVVVVADPPEAVPPVHDELAEVLKQSHHVFKQKVYRHESDIWVSCFLLEGYLELDLGVWSFEKLRATKAHWRVIYDTTPPQIEDRLRTTVPDRLIGAEEAARESMTLVWQFIRGASVAVSRGHAIAAMKEMQYLRDKVGELLLLEKGLAHDAVKELGTIPSPSLSRLVQTYEGPLDREGLYEKLVATVELYFWAVAEVLGEDSTDPDYRMAMEMVAEVTGREPRTARPTRTVGGRG